MERPDLQELCAQTASPLFLAHVGAATGNSTRPADQLPPGPRRRWLFVHNGFVDYYPRLRRDLMLALEPRFFERIEGTTDSELFFLPRAHLRTRRGSADGARAHGWIRRGNRPPARRG